MLPMARSNVSAYLCIRFVLPCTLAFSLVSVVLIVYFLGALIVDPPMFGGPRTLLQSGLQHLYFHVTPYYHGEGLFNGSP